MVINMVEIELISEGISKKDNVLNVEMSFDEIWFLKNFIKKYNPKKIVEIGISAGGNTVNLLNWKDKDAQLFSIDISTTWYRDDTKLSGFMAEELGMDNNWTIYRGFDYLDVYEDIGNDIDCVIIDTTHVLPGEILTFLVALPHLKDGCIVILHDIHLNMLRFSNNCFSKTDMAAFCTGLLFGGVSSNNKYILKSEGISNIGAFLIDKSTRDNIKDIFHILCTSWHFFPSGLNFFEYKRYIAENYSAECYNLFYNCLKLHANYFNINIHKTAETARVDIINKNKKSNSVEVINLENFINVSFPDWFKMDYGEGIVLETKMQSFDIKLKCINDGVLNIYLRGPDARNVQGERVPSYINYNNFIVNNEIIIKDEITCWHDNPYLFEKSVKDGEIIDLHFEWEYYETSTIPFKGSMKEFEESNR